MLITLMAIGSRGDVQPLVALGCGLRQRGHQVSIVAGNEFDSLVKGTALDFIPLGINIQEVMEAHTNIFHFMEDIKENILKVSCLDQDAVISTFLGISTCPVARARNIPFFYVLPMPSLQTREFPNPLFPRLPFGKRYNELTYRIADGQVIRSYPDAGCLLTKPRPNYLFCFSPHVVPRPSDWGDFAHVTGYWFLDHPNEWHPSDELVTFLQTGAPPVYVGFGSTLTKDTKAITRIVLDALAAVKQRAVFVTGWGGLKTDEIQLEDVFVTDSVPFDWLFPRVKAAIHHGWAGTTAAALRAAIPSVIVPFGADQSFWAYRMKALGVAAEPILPKRLTAKRLAAAIQRVLENDRIRENANILGEKIRREDGVKNAITIIERVLAEKW